MSAEITVVFDLADDGGEDDRRKLVEELQELESKRQAAGGDELTVLDREIQEKQSLLANMAGDIEAEVERDEPAVQRRGVEKLKLDAHRAGISLAWFFERN